MVRFQVSHLLLLMVILALGLGWGLDRWHRGTRVDLPNLDPLLSAIENRFGKPDSVSGSGRMFLHYDLNNGSTIILVVSGKKVIGVQHDRSDAER